MPQACECQVNMLDMPTLAITLHSEGCHLVPELP